MTTKLMIAVTMTSITMVMTLNLHKVLQENDTHIQMVRAKNDFVTENEWNIV